jgi:hypothetical protein
MSSPVDPKTNVLTVTHAVTTTKQQQPTAASPSNNNTTITQKPMVLGSAYSTPFPTPEASPTTSTATSNTIINTKAVIQNTRHILNAVTPLPCGLSDTCSVATQTAELLADWTEDEDSNIGSTRKFAIKNADVLASMTTAKSCSVGTGTSSIADDILDGTSAVIMSLVLKGDQHWETSNPRRCKTKGAKANIEYTVSGIIRALHDGGLLREEVAITMVVYLRRLSAKHAKYVSRFTIKKYLVASCMVANKTCSDQFYCLEDYAKAVGITKSCVAESEIQFLTTIDYDVQIGLPSEGRVSMEEERAKITFFQTSVLIHDMAMAAAAMLVVDATPACATTNDLLPVASESKTTNLAATTSIANIVEGILANAEARM